MIAGRSTKFHSSVNPMNPIMKNKIFLKMSFVSCFIFLYDYDLISFDFSFLKMGVGLFHNIPTPSKNT